MKTFLAAFLLVGIQICSLSVEAGDTPAGIDELFPANGATDVSPDVHLRITFSSPPPLGVEGTIRIYEASNDDEPVDTLDLSKPIPPNRGLRKINSRTLRELQSISRS